MADDKIRPIKIKTGVVKRYTKEKQMYEQEAEQQRAKIQKYKEEGKEEHFMKLQEKVLQESLMMVPDCQKRLRTAVEELQTLLDNASDLSETEEFKAAKQILADGNAQLVTAE